VISFTLTSETEIGQLIVLGIISKHIKNRKVTGASQHRFMQGNSCLTKSIDSCNEIRALVDEGRAVNMVYLDF